MIRLFLANNILVLIALPFIISIYHLLNSQFGLYEQEFPVNFGFWGVFLEANSIILKTASFIVILINALLLNWVFNKNEFLERNSYIVSLLYVTTLSLYHSFYTIDGSLISHLFFILMFMQFFQLNQNQDAKRLIFNGCFFAGVAATFHPILMFAFPFCLAMILIIRPFVFRDFFLGLIGFGLPLIYGFIFILFKNNDLFFFGQLKELKITIDFIATLIILVILFVLTILSLRSRLQKSSLRLKKQIRIITLFIWLSLIIGILNLYYISSIEQFSFLLIPISILLTYSFLHKNIGIIASIVFYLMVFYSVTKFFILNPYQSM
jgi:hypothetical protein